MVAGERLKCEITARNAIGESLGELPARLGNALDATAAVLDADERPSGRPYSFNVTRKGFVNLKLPAGRDRGERFWSAIYRAVGRILR